MKSVVVMLGAPETHQQCGWAAKRSLKVAQVLIEQWQYWAPFKFSCHSFFLSC
jgi:hypothetical protein